MGCTVRILKLIQLSHVVDEPLHDTGIIVALKKLRALKPFNFVRSGHRWRPIHP